MKNQKLTSLELQVAVIEIKDQLERIFGNEGSLISLGISSSSFSVREDLIYVCSLNNIKVEPSNNLIKPIFEKVELDIKLIIFKTEKGRFISRIVLRYRYKHLSGSNGYRAFYQKVENESWERSE